MSCFFPSRPATSFRWFTSPFKTLRYIVWRNYKWIIIGVLITLIIIAAVVIFLYSMPVSVCITFFSQQEYVTTSLVFGGHATLLSNVLISCKISTTLPTKLLFQSVRFVFLEDTGALKFITARQIVFSKTHFSNSILSTKVRHSKPLNVELK